ncbi:hypothetical protein J0B03_09180 [Alkalibacter rhizosphaerae]|uniref:DRTGG domain-containing protein n=1 Tax=Alkalibacter rhizosphaerae TaxID=2815577 RepID=A0A975AHG0_9FIRM|nr:DRTGG domain-containing protein [Alkalibacter rhizosphaerae]QSX07973.1 hypothetical protein J0B03_09180 [Alkalibacter rhizosphaerae]
MKLLEIKEFIDAKVLCGEEHLKREVAYACACDLMSEVLRLADKDMVLITGLTNIHVLKTAEMANIRTLIFVWGKLPDDTLVQEAKELDMVVLSTELPMYECCGILYKKGLGEPLEP